MERCARLYGALVVAVICMDKSLSSYLDIGLFLQTICLAAQGYGVDSIIASAFISQPDILRRELEIPESLNIIMGVGPWICKSREHHQYLSQSPETH